MLSTNQELWSLFTRKEEYSPKYLDKHNRFTYANSMHANILEPTVSQYLMENGLEVEYPENKKFAVFLSHDIDDVYPPFQHMLLSSLNCFKKFNLAEFKHQTLWKIKNNKNSPYINFKEIMELEEKYNAKSSFFFISTDEDPIRFRYHIEDIQNEMGAIVDNGWEVGLHGGYYAYNSLDEIMKEKARLEKALGRDIIGYRNHYLRFKVPDSWELLEKAGFKYDTTFGYNDMIGFRNGMCHPFKPYNLTKKSFINILEIPLIIMDGALFSYTSSFDEAWKYTKYIIDYTEKLNGVLCVLWHNHVFGSSFRTKWVKLYLKLLNYCYSKNAWMTSGDEIYKLWNENLNTNYTFYENNLFQ